MGTSTRDCFASCGVMASSASYKQDLPPKGGYAPINFRRIPARQVLNAPIIFTGLIGSMAVGHWLYKRGMRTWKTWQTEYRSATLALTPMMLAERDRKYLKQCRRNRDAEAKHGKRRGLGGGDLVWPPNLQDNRGQMD